MAERQSRALQPDSANRVAIAACSNPTSNEPTHLHPGSRTTTRAGATAHSEDSPRSADCHQPDGQVHRVGRSGRAWVEAEFGQRGDVSGIVVVMVAGVTGRLGEKRILSPFERPDVGVDVAALHLVPIGRGAPQETVGKGRHRVVSSLVDARVDGVQLDSARVAPCSPDPCDLHVFSYGWLGSTPPSQSIGSGWMEVMPRSSMFWPSARSLTAARFSSCTNVRRVLRKVTGENLVR